MIARRRWFAGLLLLCVGRLLSPQAVPVYDGVGNPDEPYRYAGREPRASSAEVTVSGSGVGLGAVRLQTREKGPQFLLDLPEGALRPVDAAAPPDAGAVSYLVVAEPRSPSGELSRGQFDSNAYALSIRPSVRTAGAAGFVFLRAETMTRPDPVMVYRAAPDRPWSELTSRRASQDVIAGPAQGVGEYALIRLPGAQDIGSGGFGPMTTVLLVVLVAVLLTITVVYLRQERDDLD